MPDTDGPSRPSPIDSWDWRAELVRQERNVPWLARHSRIHWRTLYRLYNREQAASPDQLRAIARAFGMAGPDGADL